MFTNHLYLAPRLRISGDIGLLLPSTPICPKGRGQEQFFISMYFKVHIIQRCKQFFRTRLSEYARGKMISSVESVGNYGLR